MKTYPSGLLLSQLITFIFFALSCQDQDEFWDVGTGFAAGNSNVILVDTFSLKASTVLLDSVRTSGTGQMMVGAYTHHLLGKVQSSSYFQVNFHTLLAPDLEYILDSIELLLPYTGYYEGDTSQYQNIYVHRLTEDIEPDDSGLLYNNNRFEVAPKALGSIRFRAFPQSGEDISIRLPDELGEQWMDILTGQYPDITTPGDFIDAFKGIVLSPEVADEAAILGFIASDPQAVDSDNSLPESTSRIRIHYQEIGITPVTKTYDFFLHNQSLQFNAIETDRSQTPLRTIGDQHELLYSDQTEETVFLQASSGFLPKIDIPNLEPLYNRGEGIILHAELVVEPIKGTYSARQPLIGDLLLYHTDRNNEIGAVLQDPNTQASILPVLEIDYLFQENTVYRFPLTSYLNDILTTDEYQDNALFISLPPSNYQATLTSLSLGGPGNRQNPMRLEIYYSTNDVD